jgi:hypothetical protein
MLLYHKGKIESEESNEKEDSGSMMMKTKESSDGKCR